MKVPNVIPSMAKLCYLRCIDARAVLIHKGLVTQFPTVDGGSFGMMRAISSRLQLAPGTVLASRSIARNNPAPAGVDDGTSPLSALHREYVSTCPTRTRLHSFAVSTTYPGIAAWSCRRLIPGIRPTFLSLPVFPQKGAFIGSHVAFLLELSERRFSDGTATQEYSLRLSLHSPPGSHRQWPVPPSSSRPSYSQTAAPSARRAWCSSWKTVWRFPVVGGKGLKLLFSPTEFRRDRDLYSRGARTQYGGEAFHLVMWEGLLEPGELGPRCGTAGALVRRHGQREKPCTTSD